MSNLVFYRLNRLSVVDVVGSEADKIVHNLTTNEIKKLDVDAACESFVTDVRGKTVGHVSVVRTEDGYRLVGAAGQSEAIAAHVDRYTIREDASPSICDDHWAAVLLPPESAQQIGEIALAGAHSISVDWASPGSILLICPRDDSAAMKASLVGAGMQQADEAAFHDRRVSAGFPWFGIDLTDKNLPQEADRETQTICFTKGCYLGQETVARLDALGQVQKKLVLWDIQGGVPAAGTELVSSDKVVARLTSVAKISETTAVGIGMTRRSHFDGGASAGVADSKAVVATVKQ